MSLVEGKEQKEVAITWNFLKITIILLILLFVLTLFIGFQTGKRDYISSHEFEKIYVCEDGKEYTSPYLCHKSENQNMIASTTVITATTLGSDKTTTTNINKETGNTLQEVVKECINAPDEGCWCTKWKCPEDPPETTTTTTCITLPITNYVPGTKSYKMVLNEQEFKPQEVEVFIGDTAFVIIENKKGLYRLRDPLNNKSFKFEPGDTYMLGFDATSTGRHIITCSEHCSRNTKATINVVKPYKEICGHPLNSSA